MAKFGEDLLVVQLRLRRRNVQRAEVALAHARFLMRLVRSCRAESDEVDVAFEEDKGKLYWFAMWALAGLTLVVFRFFAGSLTTMVDFATIVSFITAPVLGYLNLRAVTADHVPVTFRPNRVLRVFSYLGLVLLGGTAVGFSLSLVWG